MTTAVFDKGTELLAPGAALTGNGNSTGVLLYPRQLPTCDWVIYWSALVATGTYQLNLAVSDVVGGTYTSIAQFTIPPTLASGRVHLSVQGNQAAVVDNDSKFIRVNYTLAGSGPSAVIGSFLTKAASNAGLGVRVQDAFTAA